MKNERSKLFSKKGGTVGFTTSGNTVAGCYLSKSCSWCVSTSLPNGLVIETRRFGNASEADVFALSIVDAAKTAELKWW